MENAAEALKIAAWVLIIVVALSICINSFSQARQTMDAIFSYNDKEYEYTYVESNGTTEREVGYESIVPTIYRAYKENYKIIFPESYELYFNIVIDNGTVNKESVNYIDLERQTINESSKEDFIKGILFGKDAAGDLSRFPNIEFPSKSESLYSKIKEKKYKEHLGVYYQEEAGMTNEDLSSTPDASKTKKRVITYEEINNN